MSGRVRDLVAHFQAVYRDRMQGLPIVNPRLAVEAVGFRTFEDDDVGVLITPWFVNLLALPRDAEWPDLDPGANIERALPGGNYEFTVCRDHGIGVYLSAVLFRTVTDFPDQETARAIAAEIMTQLFTFADTAHADTDARSVSRRAVLTGMQAD